MPPATLPPGSRRDCDEDGVYKPAGIIRENVHRGRSFSNNLLILTGNLGRGGFLWRQ
jgi:hypothetical protein